MELEQYIKTKIKVWNIDENKFEQYPSQQTINDCYDNSILKNKTGLQTDIKKLPLISIYDTLEAIEMARKEEIEKCISHIEGAYESALFEQQRTGSYRDPLYAFKQMMNNYIK